MDKEKRNSFERKDILMIASGVFFLFLALLINRLNVFRLLFCLIGIFLFSCLIYKKMKKYGVLSFVILMLATILLDTLVALEFKRIPIFTYNIISSSDIKVYSGIGVRVWQCDSSYKNLKSETFSNKGFLCDPSYLSEIDVNTLIGNLKTNYDDYVNRYIKVGGRVSLKDGNKIIEMKAYDVNSFIDNNDFVYDDMMVLRFIFEDDTNGIMENDEVTIIGKVKNKEVVNNTEVIYVYESEIAP